MNLKPEKIRFDGKVLGFVTDTGDNQCRLVLKPVYKQFPALKKLVRKHDGHIIDVEQPASDVKEEIRRLAVQKRENKMPEPSGGKRFELTGNTYPVKETLKEVGFKWDGDDKLWYTYDRGKWEAILADLDLEKKSERSAEVPYSSEPNQIDAFSELQAYRNSREDSEDGPNQEMVLVSTDGACTSGTWSGGWAAVIQYGDTQRTISGEAANTTNNRMELMAIIKALQEVPDGAHVLVRSDSTYAMKAIRGTFGRSTRTST